MTTNALTSPPRTDRLHYAWVVLATTTLVLLASGGVRATWLNQPYLRDVFAPGQQVVLFGLVQLRAQGGRQPEILDPGRGAKPGRCHSGFAQGFEGGLEFLSHASG